MDEHDGTRATEKTREENTVKHHLSGQSTSLEGYVPPDLVFTYSDGEIDHEKILDLRKVHLTERQSRRRRASIEFLEQEYLAIYLVDFAQDTIDPFIVGNANSTLDDDLEGKVQSYSEREEIYITIFVHPADRDWVREELSLENVRKKLAENGSFTITYRRIYGDAFGYEQIRMVMLKDIEGIAVLAMRNVSEEIRDDLRQMSLLQDALNLAQESNQAHSAFLANLSHDIRTPMNSIIGFTELARKHLDDPKRMEEYLGKINLASNHLLDLINDILDVSRMQNGKLTLDEKPVNLKDLMRDLASIFQVQTEERKIGLVVDASGIYNERVYGDTLRLNQIFINIVGNAVKFTNPGGRIIVTAKQAESTADDRTMFVFSCKDTGRGMSPEFIKRIFKPFERELRPHDHIEGTGLGMPITKNLVDLMGGTIEIKSQLGVGSEFIVTLNMRNASKEAGVSLREYGSESYLESFASAGSGKIQRILVVDDDLLSQEIIGELLKDNGFSVENANDGQEALNMVSDSPEAYYDVILMDCRMPVMDGYTATREIRALDRDDVSNIPIIATTAAAFDEDRNRALECGMTAHLSKPLNIHQLLSIITDN